MRDGRYLYERRLRVQQGCWQQRSGRYGVNWNGRSGGRRRSVILTPLPARREQTGNVEQG